jgi:hypothetical protein
MQGRSGLAGIEAGKAPMNEGRPLPNPLQGVGGGLVSLPVDEDQRFLQPGRCVKQRSLGGLEKLIGVLRAAVLVVRVHRVDSWFVRRV